MEMQRETMNVRNGDSVTEVSEYIQVYLTADQPHGTASLHLRSHYALGDPLLSLTTRHLLNALLSHNSCHLKMSKDAEQAFPLQTPAFDSENSESWFKQFEMVMRLRASVSHPSNCNRHSVRRTYLYVARQRLV
nr:hypothetical protein HmN_000740400 [Hymenolepis microstoma]